MNIKTCALYLMVIFFIGPALKIQAQRSYLVGSLPSLNVSRSLPEGYSINFNWQSRQQYRRGTFGEDADPDFDFILNDFTLIGSRKIGLNNSIAAGYLLRVREGRKIHRSIQQFVILQRYRSFRLAHRFVTDQTYSEEEPTEFRGRYRISGEFPLNGRELDREEFYIKINNEYLNSIQAGDYDLEIRFVPMLGRVMKNGNKLELGMDYRASSFIESGSSHVFWVAVNGYFKL